MRKSIFSFAVTVLVCTLAVADAKTVLYLFGSAWPTCQAFGRGDFQNLYQKYNSSNDFVVNPAVPGGTSTPICTDETSCDWEKITLCAFQAGRNVLDVKLKYLDCMDSSKLPLFYEPAIPEACAKDQGLPWDQISKCFGGPMGDALLKEAGNVTTSAMGHGSFTLPTVLVDGKVACTGARCDFQDVAKMLDAKPSQSYLRKKDQEPLSNVTISYFFASKWPLCRNFGSQDWPRIFSAFQNGVTIYIVPGIRVPEGKCVDSQNCNYERVTLCAFDGQSVAMKTKFLDCMDAPWYDPLTWGKSHKCADQLSLSWPKISDCYNGTRGDVLEKEASKLFVKAFPKPVYFPQITVDGKVVDADYDSVVKAACNDGASSSAC